QVLKLASIELHAAKTALAVVLIVRSDVHRSGVVVYSVNVEHLKIALGDLVLQLGIGAQGIRLVEGVEIEMRMAVTPARPDESVPRFKKEKFLFHLYPAFIFFAKPPPRFSALRVNEIKIELILGAVEQLGPEHTVTNPAEARNVGVLVVDDGDPFHR